MKFGYARVSKSQQNLDRQLEMLKQAGCEQLFVEKMTGTLASRPELDKLLVALRKGDIVVVESFSRLARSTKNLLELVDSFDKKGVHLVSLKESLDTQTAHGKMMLGIYATISQFERDLVVERTTEGLAAARARGKKGGRRPTSTLKIEKAKKMYQSQQFTVDEIVSMVGISRTTLYRALGTTHRASVKGGTGK